MTVTVTTLAEMLAEKDENLTKSQIKLLIRETFERIMGAVVAGEDVRIEGVCKFSRTERPARVGTNPQTRAPLEIPAAYGVTIRPGAAFKGLLYDLGEPPAPRRVANRRLA